jgi:hypothetical protein
MADCFLPSVARQDSPKSPTNRCKHKSKKLRDPHLKEEKRGMEARLREEGRVGESKNDGYQF